MNMHQQERLRFIEFCLYHFGEINREHIAEYFGMSLVQASLDIREYSKLAPRNVYYDKSTRRYVYTELFERKFAQCGQKG